MNHINLRLAIMVITNGLLNSVSTTSRIGVVATEENKKSYVGSKLGGYSETFEGAKCWSDRSSDSLYNAEATLNNDGFLILQKTFTPNVNLEIPVMHALHYTLIIQMLHGMRKLLLL